MEPVRTEFKNVKCLRDNVDMVQKIVEVSYLTHTWPVELMACPICGQTYVPEDLCLKMHEVEATLEEK